MSTKPSDRFVEVTGNHSFVLRAIAGMMGTKFEESLFHNRKHRKPRTKTFIDVNVIQVSAEELEGLLAGQWADSLRVYRLDITEEVLLRETKRTKIVSKTRTKVPRVSYKKFRDLELRVAEIERQIGVREIKRTVTKK
jgi:hypothetical protein